MMHDYICNTVILYVLSHGITINNKHITLGEVHYSRLPTGLV